MTSFLGSLPKLDKLEVWDVSLSCFASAFLRVESSSVLGRRKNRNSMVKLEIPAGRHWLNNTTICFKNDCITNILKTLPYYGQSKEFHSYWAWKSLWFHLATNQCFRLQVNIWCSILVSIYSISLATCKMKESVGNVNLPIKGAFIYFLINCSNLLT